jgi:hypothetical protein
MWFDPAARWFLAADGIVIGGGADLTSAASPNRSGDPRHWPGLL